MSILKVRPLGLEPRGRTTPFRGLMTTPTTSEAKDLIALAERMGIPCDEALRQIAQLVDLVPTVQNADVLRTFCAPEAAQIPDR
jgi:hypothetical protein